MLDSISPYALLQASKPKGTPTVTTAYDCYSALQLTLTYSFMSKCRTCNNDD